MDQQEQDKMLTEMKVGDGLALLPAEDSSVSATEYKLMQSQFDNGLVKCMKLLYNGRTELFYETAGLKPLTATIGQMGFAQLLLTVRNLIESIVNIKNNGFLSETKVDASPDHIFIDPSTYKVKLIYLPLTTHFTESGAFFENRVREELTRAIMFSGLMSSPDVKALVSDLSNGNLPLESLCAGIVVDSSSLAAPGGQRGQSSGRTHTTKQPVVMEPEVRQPERTPQPPVFAQQPEFAENAMNRPLNSLRLVAVNNNPRPFVMDINKPLFTIGKRNTNDGIIDYSEYVSKMHCRILSDNGCFYLSDSGSVNGTFINGVRLKAGEQGVIKNGDIIKIANCFFRADYF